ncbi:hypothetical protein, partial [Pseudomonas syringae]|uniref:hypothetical protein n=1 Tax=Pseudomonas syringae TaxID=317 RepID=UPI001F1E0F65
MSIAFRIHPQPEKPSLPARRPPFAKRPEKIGVAGANRATLRLFAKAFVQTLHIAEFNAPFANK